MRAPDALRRAAAARAQGFSLIEVAFATALLALLILGLSATLASSQQADTFTREHQAAAEAAYRQVDLIMSLPSIDDIAPGQRTGADVPSLAFHVPYGPATLTPADAAYVPRNVDDAGTVGVDESTMAGHVRVVELDLDGDGDPDDYDLDGRADLLAVQVIVAWRGDKGGSSPNRRLDLSVRRTR